MQVIEIFLVENKEFSFVVNNMAAVDQATKGARIWTTVVLR